MHTILGLTDTNAVRAALGVIEEEVPDEHFINHDVAGELDIDLTEWLPDGTSLLTYIEASESDSPDPEELKVFKLLSFYSKYFCALLVAQASDLLFVEQVSDGQNETRRSRRSSYDSLLAKLEGSADKYKKMVLEELGAATTAAATLFSRATPAYDPVLNEEL